MKTCSKCSVKKDISSFSKNSWLKSGFNNVCKECMSEYRQRDNKAYARKDYLKRRDKMLEESASPEGKKRRREKYYAKTGRFPPEVTSNREPIVSDYLECEKYLRRIIRQLPRRGKGWPKETDLNAKYIADLLSFQGFKCSYTGLSISMKDKTASLDRKDNEQGYTMNNVHWVHKKINFMKGSISHEEFLETCRLIVVYGTKY